MGTQDFNIPTELSADVKEAAQTIINTIQDTFGKDASGGGCRLFYTVDEWKDRGEEYGTTAALILVHDGGDAAPFLNLNYMVYDLHEKLRASVSKQGFYIEQCTSWYSAMYPNPR